MDNFDEAPAKSSSDVDSQEQDNTTMLDKKEYLRPQNMTSILHKKFGMFGAIVGLYYVIQFCMCVAACNFYSDISRMTPCAMSSGVIVRDEQASAVFDTALKLCGIFHVIEWIRATFLLTVVCIGVNLMTVWYATALSSLYGVAVFFYMMSVMASDLG